MMTPKDFPVVFMAEPFLVIESDLDLCEQYTKSLDGCFLPFFAILLVILIKEDNIVLDVA